MNVSSAFPVWQTPLVSVIICLASAMILAAVLYRFVMDLGQRAPTRIKRPNSGHFGKIPLADAARITAQACGDSRVSRSAEQYGTRPNGALLFYCFHLASLMPIYGKPMHSRSLKQLSSETILDLRFSIVNTGLIATELIGQNVYVDLRVDKKSLYPAIDHFKQSQMRRDAAYHHSSRWAVEVR
jgi:hypothetical protein